MTDTQAFADISAPRTTELAETYITLWNEPDAGRRRQTIEELWAEDGTHVLQPPEEIRAIAARPGVGMPAVLIAQGHDQIEVRVTSGHEHWVASEGITFR